jgi:CheY-like chemotaxis protein
MIGVASDPDWFAISSGVLRGVPDASLCRVETGTQALRTLFAQKPSGRRDPNPDLVILDSELPFESVQTIVKRLREDPRTCAIPVILICSTGNLLGNDLSSSTDVQLWLVRPPSAASLEGDVASAVRRIRRSIAEQIA